MPYRDETPSSAPPPPPGFRLPCLCPPPFVHPFPQADESSLNGDDDDSEAASSVIVLSDDDDGESGGFQGRHAKSRSGIDWSSIMSGSGSVGGLGGGAEDAGGRKAGDVEDGSGEGASSSFPLSVSDE